MQSCGCVTNHYLNLELAQLTSSVLFFFFLETVHFYFSYHCHLYINRCLLFFSPISLTLISVSHQSVLLSYFNIKRCSGHPYLPYLATSGLDTTAKLWLPTGIQRPIADKESELYKEVNVSSMKNDTTLSFLSL